MFYVQLWGVWCSGYAPGLPTAIQACMPKPLTAMLWPMPNPPFPLTKVVSQKKFQPSPIHSRCRPFRGWLHGQTWPLTNMIFLCSSPAPPWVNRQRFGCKRQHHTTLCFCRTMWGLARYVTRPAVYTYHALCTSCTTTTHQLASHT
jgi:hypothetical protein